MHADDLPKFASELVAEGIKSYELGVPIPGKGIQIGLMISAIGFFPIWELNAPENAGLVAARDFAAIKANRPPNWEMVEPRFWDRSAAAKGE
jgi:hypothetical protein